MKTVFIIGLLAVSTAAFYRYDDYPVRRNLPFGYWPPYDLDDYYDVESTEPEPEPQPEPQPQPEPETTPEPQPETTTTPFPLPYESRKLVQELELFGSQFIAYSLNLTYFECDGCFPVRIYWMKVADLLAIKSYLNKIYGTEYDHLLQQEETELRGDAEGEHPGSFIRDIDNGQDGILQTWNDVWFALENKTFPKYREQSQSQYDTVRIFSQTFGIEKIRETHKRFLRVFGPGLKKTDAVQSLVGDARFFKRSARVPRHTLAQSYDGIPHGFDQKHLVEKIHTFIRRMYTYVYDLDPLGKDYMTGFIADHLKGFSIKSLLIFDHYLEKTFGQAMSEIPEKPHPSAQHRREKVHIVRELKDMMATTLNVWRQDLIHVLPEDVQFSDRYLKEFEVHANILADFLGLEDLRRVLRKATPILGWAKKPHIIPEDTFEF